MASFVPNTVADYKVRKCIGFTYDETGEKVICEKDTEPGRRYCKKCIQYLDQPQTVGWGCGRLRQGIAGHVKADIGFEVPYSDNARD